MIISTSYNVTSSSFVVCIFGIRDAGFRKELLEKLARNLKKENALDWEELASIKYQLTEDEDKMLWVLDWSLYVQNGLRGKSSVREEFSDARGYHIVIEFKESKMERLRTWARRKLGR
ncbi:hypothetical protein A2456_00230 [Candidatus Nomurabacteria bacterium RIFOXYC2_FULL_36_19]|nr:MAG: hypothetical protein A2238_02920 [Candidatus Nomurabacteria bacterium RIFOXYA2_FULL_35_9]OGJ09733.1 MAG: hypothetical protein A2456_00230 [Candidatus Nomurabacteria bacterium RIFOXYC2_FULL_36_19]OGJ14547.1 MAG: hypothetical protein A2554_01970 [Candidatus Nomurabacteria bacterium RIFOXYD2_FULL_35_12]